MYYYYFVGVFFVGVGVVFVWWWFVGRVGVELDDWCGDWYVVFDFYCLFVVDDGCVGCD